MSCGWQVLRDHRQTEDHTLCPPWCLTVNVSAHSFQPGNEHFIPRFALQHPQVVSQPNKHSVKATLVVLLSHVHINMGARSIFNVWGTQRSMSGLIWEGKVRCLGCCRGRRNWGAME